ncbi:hypothetical protein GOODEAATRI_002001, partial [Goodea atripinnis]
RIAQSLKEEQMKQMSQESVFSDVKLEDADGRRNSNAGSVEPSRLHTSVSPADLHGMWYPTVRRTLVCLSKLYRCIDGTPEIKEHYIDSKKDVDRHLKFSCEQFIQQQTQIFVGNLEEFLTKVSALKTMAVQGGPTYSLSQQPWAQPAKINDIVMATYRVMKSKLPSTLQSMSLYLANRDTEFILFKPVRVNTSAQSDIRQKICPVLFHQTVHHGHVRSLADPLRTQRTSVPRLEFRHLSVLCSLQHSASKVLKAAVDAC